MVGRFGSIQSVNRFSHISSNLFSGGWDVAPDRTIYFCGHFDQHPTSAKTFTGHNESLSSYGSTPTTNGTNRQGGVFSFNTTTVTSRVGVSFISSDKACSNVQTEIPEGTKLQGLVDQAQERWNEDVFRKVTTTETNTTVLKQLYSYLYGMNLLPSNRRYSSDITNIFFWLHVLILVPCTGTGENPLWESSEPSVRSQEMMVLRKTTWRYDGETDMYLV